MIIYESKLEGTQNQYERLDGAIRTGRFVRNSIIRAWIDNQIKGRNSAYAYCKVLADSSEFPWAKQLNSQARQAHAERAWAAIERFDQIVVKSLLDHFQKRSDFRIMVLPDHATPISLRTHTSDPVPFCMMGKNIVHSNSPKFSEAQAVQSDKIFNNGVDLMKYFLAKTDK